MSISALNYVSFGDTYQYRRYPRKAVAFQNISSLALSGLQFSFDTDDFILWESLLPSSAAIISAGERFVVQFDFQPQTVGNIYGTLNIQYEQNEITYADSISSMSGIGVAIPIANYYVSSGGSDSDAGTISAPFATIKKAFGLCSSGELIYVRSGVYDEHLGQYYEGASANPAHGSANDWTWNITVAAYPGEEVVIQKSGSATPNQFQYEAFFFGLTGEKYFTFEDIIFDGTAATASTSAAFNLGNCTWHSSYIKFWNCEFKNRHDWGYPYLSGIPRSFNTCLGVSTTGIEFWYCKIHDYDEHGIYLSSSSGDASPTSPAYLPRSACDCKFMYNEMYNGGMNATGQAGFYQSYGFHGNNNNIVGEEASWYRPFERNNLIEGNYIHNITSGGILLGGNLSSTAQNNICVSCSGGGLLDYYSGCSGNHYYNNTIINCDIGVRLEESSSAAVVKNNIFYNNNSYDYYVTTPTNPEVTNNLTYDNTLSVTSNNLYSTDPLFVDVNNNIYSLKSTSPCIGYGQVLSSVTSDFYNLRRISNTGNDIGAINYNITTGVELISERFGATYTFPDLYFNLKNVIITELEEIIKLFKKDPLTNYKLIEWWYKDNIKNNQGNSIINLPFDTYAYKLLEKAVLTKAINLNEWYEWYFTYLLKDVAFLATFPLEGTRLPQVSPSKIINIYKFSYDIINSEPKNIANVLLSWILSQKTMESWTELNSLYNQPAVPQIKNVKVRILSSAERYPEKNKQKAQRNSTSFLA